MQQFKYVKQLIVRDRVFFILPVKHATSYFMMKFENADRALPLIDKSFTQAETLGVRMFRTL